VRLAYIDTSFVLNILLETGKSDLAEQLLEAHQDAHFVISGIAINETLYVTTYEYYRRQDMLKGRFGLRRLIAEQGYPKGIINAEDSS